MKKILFATIFVALGLTSCGFYLPTNVPSSIGAESFAYEYLGEVSGYDESSRILFFGGTDNRKGAVRDMYERANLKPDEAIINIQSSMQIKDYVVYSKEEYRATGQKVRILNAPERIYPSVGKTVARSSQSVSVPTRTQTQTQTVQSQPISSRNEINRTNCRDVQLFTYLCSVADKNGDKVISEEEASTVENLGLPEFYKFVDLDYVMAMFVNLKGLRVTSLNGSTLNLSKNILLKNLSFKETPSAKSIVLPKTSESINLKNVPDKAIENLADVKINHLD